MIILLSSLNDQMILEWKRRLRRFKSRFKLCLILIFFSVYRLLIDSKELIDFINVRIFLDEDFTRTEKFTVSINLQNHAHN